MKLVQFQGQKVPRVDILPSLLAKIVWLRRKLDSDWLLHGLEMGGANNRNLVASFLEIFIEKFSFVMAKNKINLKHVLFGSDLNELYYCLLYANVALNFI